MPPDGLGCEALSRYITFVVFQSRGGSIARHVHADSTDHDINSSETFYFLVNPQRSKGARFDMRIFPDGPEVSMFI